MKNVQPKQQLHLREKLLTSGVQAMSDTELLAVFISSGNAQNSCLKLAQDLLSHLGDLRGVLNADYSYFKQIRGIGEVRYTQLQAVKEICRRSDFIQLQKDTSLNNSQQTHVYLKRRLRDKKYETFVALFLDNQNRVLAYEELFQGTINTASVHPRPIIERVLRLNAAAVILAHNHPSGLSDASEEDLAVTLRLGKALDLIDTRLLDHLVIGDNEVYSIMHKAKWNCH